MSKMKELEYDMRELRLRIDYLDRELCAARDRYIALDKQLASNECQARWEAFVKENPLKRGEQYEITFPEGVNPLRGGNL